MSSIIGSRCFLSILSLGYGMLTIILLLPTYTRSHWSKPVQTCSHVVALKSRHSTFNPSQLHYFIPELSFTSIVHIRKIISAISSFFFHLHDWGKVVHEPVLVHCGNRTSQSRARRSEDCSFHLVIFRSTQVKFRHGILTNYRDFSASVTHALDV